MSFPWIDAAGALGGFLFSTACIPMAMKTWRLGRGIGTPRSTIWTFIGATLLTSIYLVGKVGQWQPATLFLESEVASWCVVAWFEYFPRKPRHDPTRYAFDPRDMEFCTRPAHESGPCNGYPRRDCPMTIEVRKRFYPD